MADGWSAVGSAPSTSYGWTTLLHDLDGDGRDELVIGADGWDGPKGSEGRVELFRGRAGLAAGATPDATAEGVGHEDRLGSALDACDIDGDETVELLIGADGAGKGDPGGVLVYELGTSGPAIQQ